MSEREGIGDLLGTARAALAGAMPDGASESQRYTARMVLRALDIAARDAAAGDEPLLRQLELFAALYGDAAAGALDGTPRERVAAMNERLARDIRAGVLDGACALAVRVLLLEQTEQRLRISNPRYLASYCGSDEPV